MSPWRWLLARIRPAVPASAVTPPAEHAEARRRINEISREADRIERLVDDYRRMGRSLR